MDLNFLPFKKDNKMLNLLLITKILSGLELKDLQKECFRKLEENDNLNKNKKEVGLPVYDFFCEMNDYKIIVKDKFMFYEDDLSGLDNNKDYLVILNIDNIPIEGIYNSTKDRLSWSYSEIKEQNYFDLSLATEELLVVAKKVVSTGLMFNLKDGFDTKRDLVVLNTFWKIDFFDEDISLSLVDKKDIITLG